MASSSACKDGHLHEEVGEEEKEELIVYDDDVEESGRVDDHHQHLDRAEP
jgi:hypothetical protein